MAFRSIDSGAFSKFNSNASFKLMSIYTSQVDKYIVEKENHKPNATFAPSSFRCKRHSWFRLRGSEPDILTSPDASLNFRADIGTACHENIQKHLSDALGDKWISIESHMKTHCKEFKYSTESNGMETLVSLEEPPVRFACDGIVEIEGERYLLEIKTAEWSSFKDLTDPKPSHIYQVEVYGALLNLNKVLFIYQDRMGGDIKVYEKKLTKRQKVLEIMADVQASVESNIAPDRLSDRSDIMCLHCKYKKKCSDWG